MSNEREIRSLRVKELRVATAADGTKTIAGVITYNTESADLGGFVEIIAPGAFSASVNGDVLLLRDHNPILLMGRTKSGTLKLSDSADGLHFECGLPKTTAADDLAESISRRDLDGVSFGFICLDDNWTYTEGKTVRTVIEAELLELSPCSWAAYPSNSVSLRSCPPEMRSKLEQRSSTEDQQSVDTRSDAGCSCVCPSCEDGNCAGCTCDDCNCSGCTCGCGCECEQCQAGNCEQCSCTREDCRCTQQRSYQYVRLQLELASL